MLARTASFGRKSRKGRSSQSVIDSDDDEPRNKNRGGEDAEEEREPEPSAQPRRGSVLRSLSFSRRNKGKHRDGAGSSRSHAEDDDRGGRGGESSERALQHDDDDDYDDRDRTTGRDWVANQRRPSAGQLPTAVARPVSLYGDHDTVVAEPPNGSMHGWLYKRHTHEKRMKAQWAKRYFTVDEHRGTLSYAKSEFKRPTVVLPLCDITSVKTVEMEVHGPFCFVISCPPVHLTVRSENVEVCSAQTRHTRTHHNACMHSLTHLSLALLTRTGPPPLDERPHVPCERVEGQGLRRLGRLASPRRHDW